MTAVATPVAVPEATPGRAAEIAAEAAYESSVSAALDAKPVAAKPTDTTPRPTATVPAEPAKEATKQPATADAPKMSADERAKWIADYKAEFPDATDEEASEAADEEEHLASGKPATDEDDDDELAEFPKPKAKESVEELTEALEAQGVTVKLDDIKDPIARKFVETRLKEMNAGFTRAMQDARSYRAREIAYRAEQRFQENHREDHIVSLLLEDPALGERVNAKLEEMESPTARKAHAVVVKDAQAQARTAEEQRSADEQKWSERGMIVEQYAMRSAAKLGVPYELGVAESIVAVIQSRTTSDEHGNVIKQGDITRAEVDQIIREKAEKYQRSIRAHKREDRKKYIAAKADDAKNAGLKVKPGAGAAPGVGKPATPQTEEEYDAFVLSRL